MFLQLWWGRTATTEHPATTVCETTATTVQRTAPSPNTLYNGQDLSRGGTDRRAYSSQIPPT